MVFFRALPSLKVDSSSYTQDSTNSVAKMDTKKVKGKQPEPYDPTSAKDYNALLKPLTKQNIFRYYVPALGTASYTLLSVRYMIPSWYFSLFPKMDVGIILLGTTVFGSGCFLYSLHHIKDSGKKGRYAYSALGSIVFNFSSIVIWSILNIELPWNKALRLVAALTSNYILIKGATNYLEFVENKIAI